MKEENKHLFTQEPDAPDNDSSSDSAVNNTPKKPTPNTYKFRPTAARAVPQAKVYKVGFISVYVVFAISFALALCNYLLLSKTDFYDGFDGLRSDILQAIALVIVYVIPSVIYSAAVKKEKTTLLGVRRFSSSYSGFIIAGVFFAIILSATAKFSLAHFFSVIPPVSNVRLTDSQNPLLTILFYAFIPALCEEIFFRGVLQTEITKKAGGFAGIIVSALSYALVQFDFEYFPIYFLSGAVLALTMHVTGSVIPCVVISISTEIASMLFSVQLGFIASERTGNTLVIVVLVLLLLLIFIFYLKSLEIVCIKKAVSAEIAIKESVRENVNISPAEADENSSGETRAHSVNQSRKAVSDRDKYLSVHFYSSPFRMFSDSGYTFHKFLRVLFSPAIIAAAIVFCLVTLL